MIYIIAVIFCLLLLMRFLLAFCSISISSRISISIINGSYTSQELNEFPIYFTSKEEYRTIVKKLDIFTAQVLNNEVSKLSMTSDNINCLTNKGSTPIKPYALLADRGLLFYYFDENTLFEIKMDHMDIVQSRVCLRKNRISFALKYLAANHGLIDNEPVIWGACHFIKRKIIASG